MLKRTLALALLLSAQALPAPAAPATIGPVTIAWTDATHTKIRVTWTETTPVANYLTSRIGMTSLGVHNVMAPPDEVYAGLGLDQVSLAIIWEELDSTLDKAMALATS